ncbi:unnamed protein product [marine sediment metagenome]|uniref:Uncharacterized protein n=1 Tax=marine sediment metagenome TaxID=412755 RepID=X1DNT4_9ZZZZ
MAVLVIPVFQTPVTRTVKAVREQITIVSIKTSKEAINPCRTGSLVWAVA